MNANIPFYKTLRVCGAALAGAALVLTAACSDEFRPENQVHGEVQNFIDAESVAAARAQATLYTADFRDDQVSELGKAHIDLMLKAPEGQSPLKVYLDVPDDQHAAARQQAVGDYLLAKGVKQSRFELSMGPNPDSLSPAADKLVGLAKLNASDAGAPSSGSGPAASGSATPTGP